MDNLQEDDKYQYLEAQDTEEDDESSDDSQDPFSYFYQQVYQYDESTLAEIIVQDYSSSLPYGLNRTLYHVDWLSDSEESSSVSSLIYLCCKEVTKDANFLKKVFAYLPINRYDLLMKTAICNDFRDSAAVLISKWPLMSISTSVIDSNAMLRHIFYKTEFITVLAKRIMLLMSLFFDSAKNNTMPRLRVLDLRGIPLSDPMVYYLLCQIIDFSKDTSRSNEYHIVIDCLIFVQCTFKKLSSFLTMDNLSKNKYNPHLHINTIDVTRLDENQCCTLLQTINATDLVGLRMNSHFSFDFYTYIFTKFSLLRNLDIPILILILIESTLPFDLLPNLRRLGFAIGTSNLPTEVPLSVLCKLEYFKPGRHVLKVDHVIEQSFKHLMSTPLVLRELNLNGCVLMKDHCNLWRDFLKSLAPTLMVLELDSCVMDENLFPALVNFILPLINLRTLSLIECRVSLDVLSDYVPTLCSLPELKKLRVGCLGLSADISTEIFCDMVKLKTVNEELFLKKVEFVTKSFW